MNYSGVIEAAKEICSFGFYPIPVHIEGELAKHPVGEGWTKLRYQAADCEKLFGDSHNYGLGVLMGISHRDDQLVPCDLDWDCPEAIEAAKIIGVPPTSRVFGHACAPESHHEYLVLAGFKGHTKLEDPVLAADGKKNDEHVTIAEVHGVGRQVVFPPTPHEEGGARIWSARGEFTVHQFKNIYACAAMVASAVAFARYGGDDWEKYLCIAGLLARGGCDKTIAAHIVRGAGLLARPNDRSAPGWLDGVTDQAYQRVASGDNLYGYTKFAEIVGERNAKLIAKEIFKWLQLAPQDTGSNPKVSVGGGFLLDKHFEIKPLVANAIQILSTDEHWKGTLAYNTFASRIDVRKPTPWGKTRGQQWTDTDDVFCLEWLQRNGIEITGSRTVFEAVKAVAQKNQYHPVREYLDGLKWDGTPRIDTWLVRLLGAKCGDYVVGAGCRWVMSAVARVNRPGCQADYSLILVGPQGIKKSTSLRMLVPVDEWFTDHISRLGSKDSRQELHGKWIIEMGEALRIRATSDQDEVKAFLTARFDHYRPPYARHPIDVPRQNVFCGSVNEEEFLYDATGGRRFWPIECARVDVDGIVEERDQLWAEAVARYRKGDHIYFEKAELEELAGEQQRFAQARHVWFDRIAAFLATKDRATIAEILTNCLEVPVERQGTQNSRAVTGCLRQMGWKSVHKATARYWEPEKKSG